MKLDSYKEKFSKNSTCFLITSLFTSFIMGIFFMFIGIYLKENGYTESYVGFVMSINTMATAICSVISAYLLERIGRKHSFYIGLISIFIGQMGIVLIDNTFIIILMAVINGFGFSMQMTGEALFLTENTLPKHRVFLLSTNFVLKNIGMVLGNFFGGFISNSLSNYFTNLVSVRYVFIFSSFLALISLIPVFFIKESKLISKRNLLDCIKCYKNILGKNVVSFMMYNSIIGFGAGMVVPFFSVYLKYSMNIRDDVVGGILSFSQLGCVIGGIIIPILSNKIGKVKSVILCQVLSIPFLISIAFPQGIILVALSFFMRSALMNMAQPVIQNLAMELVGLNDRANLSSFLSLSSNFMRSLGIWVGGYLMEHYTYNTPYYFTVTFYVIGTMVFFRMYKENLTSKGWNYS